MLSCTLKAPGSIPEAGCTHMFFWFCSHETSPSLFHEIHLKWTESSLKCPDEGLPLWRGDSWTLPSMVGLGALTDWKKFCQGLVQVRVPHELPRVYHKCKSEKPPPRLICNFPINYSFLSKCTQAGLRLTSQAAGLARGRALGFCVLAFSVWGWKEEACFTSHFECGSYIGILLL